MQCSPDKNVYNRKVKCILDESKLDSRTDSCTGELTANMNDEIYIEFQNQHLKDISVVTYLSQSDEILDLKTGDKYRNYHTDFPVQEDSYYYQKYLFAPVKRWKTIITFCYRVEKSKNMFDLKYCKVTATIN